MSNSTSRRQLIIAGAAAAWGGALFLPGCGGGGGGGGGGSNTTLGPQVDDRKSIINQAESKPELSIFVDALTVCGLRDKLDSSGSSTVFAFTNDAFNAALGELNVGKDQLFADRTTLTAIVKCHIVSRALFTEAIVEGHAIDNIGGGFFKVDKENDVFKATDGRNRICTLIGKDVAALNGVLHTLDRMMLPANLTILATCEKQPEIAPQCAIAVRCIEACGLSDTLTQPGPLTFFCPTDAAFTAVFAELNTTLEVFLADAERCRTVMRCHMVPARKFKKEFETDVAVATLEGATIRVNANFQVIDARGRACNLTRADVINTNGIVHVCDKVILPPA